MKKFNWAGLASIVLAGAASGAAVALTSGNSSAGAVGKAALAGALTGIVGFFTHTSVPADATAVSATLVSGEPLVVGPMVAAVQGSGQAN